MTYTTRELIANKRAVDAVGWRLKRIKCGLRLSWAAHMIGIKPNTLGMIELGRITARPDIAAALDALYSGWAEVTRKQRELEARVQAVREGIPPSEIEAHLRQRRQVGAAASVEKRRRKRVAA